MRPVSADGEDSPSSDNSLGSHARSLAPYGGKVHFPSVSTRGSAPLGPFLSPRTTSVEAGSSYIARSGFPSLANSETFVAAIDQETILLLDSFIQAWKSEGIWQESASPFAVFKKVYCRRGWQYLQLYWSEHVKTRESIYYAFVRSLTGRLRSLLPLISIGTNNKVQVISDEVKATPKEDVLRACGILFALMSMQSSTALVASDIAFEAPSGRIPIEADLLHILVNLPRLLVEGEVFPSLPSEEGLQPLDDVIFILRELTGADVTAADSPVDVQDNATAGSEPAARDNTFDLLAPTSYNARSASVNNRMATKADMERQRELWGSLHSVDSQETRRAPLSRADLMRHLLKQRMKIDESQSLRTTQGRGEALNKEKRSAERALEEQKGQDTLLHHLDVAARKKRAYEDSKSRYGCPSNTPPLPLGDVTDGAVRSLPIVTSNLTKILASAKQFVEHSAQSSFNNTASE